MPRKIDEYNYYLFEINFIKYLLQIFQINSDNAEMIYPLSFRYIGFYSTHIIQLRSSHEKNRHKDT